MEAWENYKEALTALNEEVTKFDALNASDRKTGHKSAAGRIRKKMQELSRLKVDAKRALQNV